MGLCITHTGTKAETLAVLKANRILYPDMSDLMSKIEFKDGITDWQVAIFECRICNHKFTVVYPVGGCNEDVECSNCGNMTADIIEAA